MIEKIKSAMLYAGQTKSEWQNIRIPFRRGNGKMLQVTSTLMGGLMALLTCYTFFFDRLYPQNAKVYAIWLLSQIFILLATRFLIEKHPLVKTILVYAFIISCYSFGIMIGTVTDPNNYALAYIIMTIVLPLLFFGAPIHNFILVIFFDVVMLICSYHTKSVEVFQVDVMNVIIWTAVGTYLNIVVSAIKSNSSKVLLEMSKTQKNLQESYDHLRSQMDIFSALGNIYSAIYYISPQKNTFHQLAAHQIVNYHFKDSGDDARRELQIFCDNVVAPEFKKVMTDFVNLDTVEARLKDKGIVTQQFLNTLVNNTLNESEWCDAHMVAVNQENVEGISGVIFAVRKKHEEKLKELLQIDHLHKAFNVAEQAYKSRSTLMEAMSQNIEDPLKELVQLAKAVQDHLDDRGKLEESLQKISENSQQLLNNYSNIVEKNNN